MPKDNNHIHNDRHERSPDSDLVDTDNLCTAYTSESCADSSYEDSVSVHMDEKQACHNDKKMNLLSDLKKASEALERSVHGKNETCSEESKDTKDTYGSYETTQHVDIVNALSDIKPI